MGSGSKRHTGLRSNMAHWSSVAPMDIAASRRGALSSQAPVRTIVTGVARKVGEVSGAHTPRRIRR
eukprot:6190247-Alexandrium_andersonii.AAC.1